MGGASSCSNSTRIFPQGMMWWQGSPAYLQQRVSPYDTDDSGDHSTAEHALHTPSYALVFRVCNLGPPSTSRQCAVLKSKSSAFHQYTMTTVAYDHSMHVPGI